MQSSRRHHYDHDETTTGGSNDETPLTDAMIAAISTSCRVSDDQVRIAINCEARRAMTLSISFSITVSASDLTSSAATVGGAELQNLLSFAVSSGDFAATFNEEASMRGQVASVTVGLLESTCLTCGFDKVTITSAQVSESAYVGSFILLLIVAIPLFFGELAIFVDFKVMPPTPLLCCHMCVGVAIATCERHV
jgi:hypothetical protein